MMLTLAYSCTQVQATSVFTHTHIESSPSELWFPPSAPAQKLHKRSLLIQTQKLQEGGSQNFIMLITLQPHFNGKSLLPNGN